MDRPFEIIATRTLDILDDLGRPARQAFVHIGRPWQEPTGEWALPYQIVGLGKGKVYRVFGFDAIQALQGVQLVIGGILASSDEGEQGRLRWDGDPDLGFPVPTVPVPDR
jgi:hypothetical protein